MAEKTIRNLAELDAEAARFVRDIQKSPQGATLVTLMGELGAGKTAFVKAVAKALDIEETVNSPTFVLEKIYSLPECRHRVSTFRRLVHIDAYRLEKGAELAALGFGGLMEDAGNLILLEWPENVKESLSQPAARISFTVNADGSRTVSYA